jgi:hypothetical protein
MKKQFIKEFKNDRRGYQTGANENEYTPVLEFSDKGTPRVWIPEHEVPYKDSPNYTYTVSGYWAYKHPLIREYWANKYSKSITELQSYVAPTNKKPDTVSGVLKDLVEDSKDEYAHRNNDDEVPGGELLGLEELKKYGGNTNLSVKTVADWYRSISGNMKGTALGKLAGDIADKLLDVPPHAGYQIVEENPELFFVHVRHFYEAKTDTDFDSGRLTVRSGLTGTVAVLVDVENMIVGIGTAKVHPMDFGKATKKQGYRDAVNRAYEAILGHLEGAEASPFGTEVYKVDNILRLNWSPVWNAIDRLHTEGRIRRSLMPSEVMREIFCTVSVNAKKKNMLTACELYRVLENFYDVYGH